MSRRLLTHLNGPRRGMFRRWLEDFPGEPRIAWYPSAGRDFRDLFYLHPVFSEMNPPTRPEPPLPDIFIHTDYFPWSDPTFLDDPLIHEDRHTTVIVLDIEELPRRILPLDDEIVVAPQGGPSNGRVVFLEVEIQSDVSGRFIRPVLYVFAENAAFCARRLLPLEARLSHIIHQRYGGGCGGGGRSTGIWMLNVLQRLHCEVFVTDSHYCMQSGDERVCELYPELAGPGTGPVLEPIRLLNGQRWNCLGHVSWNLVPQAPQHLKVGSGIPCRTRSDESREFLDWETGWRFDSKRYFYK